MPTVKTVEGLRIIVNVRDEHGPSHVHVVAADWEIRVLIGAAAKVWSIKYGDPTNKQMRRAEELVQGCLADCNETWRKYHGEL